MGNLTRLQRTQVPQKKLKEAKDPKKMDMTNEKKDVLCANLRSLPTEQLKVVVPIISRRNVAAFSLVDDQIEVDIESVDAETLWELDSFVANYRKSLSEEERKAHDHEVALIQTSTERATNETVVSVTIMTEEEKDLLRENLQNLPPEKLGDVAEIINKSYRTALVGEEINQLDIGSLDEETLWEIDRFVTYFKNRKMAQIVLYQIRADAAAAEAVQGTARIINFHDLHRR